MVASPLLYARAHFTVGASDWSGSIRGATARYFTAREWGVTRGREMTLEDNSRAAKVMLIGTTMREKLFGEVDPVGATVRIRGVPFTVVGLLDRKGQNVWGDDQDDVALVPLTTARRQFVGVSRASPRLVHNISVKFAEGYQQRKRWRQFATRCVSATGYSRDRNKPSSLATSPRRRMSRRTATRTLSLLLAAVASVSLVVGGIGIMNIMLVTVTERTREIGLRLAVGAREWDMLLQFLTEATTLALLGGVLGVLVGITVSDLSRRLRLACGYQHCKRIAGNGLCRCRRLFFWILSGRKAARMIRSTRFDMNRRQQSPRRPEPQKHGSISVGPPPNLGSPPPLRPSKVTLGPLNVLPELAKSLVRW